MYFFVFCRSLFGEQGFSLDCSPALLLQSHFQSQLPKKNLDLESLKGLHHSDNRVKCFFNSSKNHDWPILNNFQL